MAQDRKKTFIERSKQEIKICKELIRVINGMTEIVKTFDGKVLNKRLINKFQSELGEDNRFLFMTDTMFGYRKIRVYAQGDRTFNIDGHFSGYTDLNDIDLWDCFAFKPNNYSLADGAQRIDAEKTNENILKYIERLEKEIAEREDCIANYDNYENRFREVEKTIRDYAKEVPYMMRKSITIGDWYAQ